MQLQRMTILEIPFLIIRSILSDWWKVCTSSAFVSRSCQRT